MLSGIPTVEELRNWLESVQFDLPSPQTAPDDDDYVIKPTGPLGSVLLVMSGGAKLGLYPDMDEALAAIKTDMDKEKHWPNIWWISDHGNFWMIDTDGNEIKQDESDDDDNYIDVRLQVHNGSWYVHEGDPSYDTDHRGFWGCGSVGPDTDCRELANDLIDQVLEDAATAGVAVDDDGEDQDEQEIPF